MSLVRKFALLGVAGFVAPRHLRAIRDVGGDLVAACDPHDSVGVLDSYFPQARFFTEVERFDRHLEKLRRSGEAVDYVSVCSPNYLHDAHCRLALRVGAHPICEKPLVIKPWNLDQLSEIEAESKKRVYTILQLRLHPVLVDLRASLPKGGHHQVELVYVTRRGNWYHHSWKGRDELSGGICMNIGIHFFDLLLWLFGRSVGGDTVHEWRNIKSFGLVELERATVRWRLSVDEDDLPEEARRAGKSAYRSMRIDGQEIDFTAGMESLHTRSYEEILAGRGFGIEEARPAIELVQKLRASER